MSTDLSIIIVSWNTKKLLEDCLTSVYADTKRHTFEIFVVDNNSPDFSAGMVKEKFPDVILTANKDNLGFAPANNQALKLAKGNNILLLNPDTVVLGNAIDKMLDYIENNSCDLLTCKLLNTDGTLQKNVNNFYSFWETLFENRFFSNLSGKLNFKKGYFKSTWDHNSTVEIDWARGAVLMFKKEVMDKIGLLDERYYIYGEEIDFYFRAKKAGYKAVFVHNIAIMHHGKSSSKQKKTQMFIQNYRSLYLFLKKNYGSFSYYLYRLRVLSVMLIWILRFKIFSIFSKKKDEERQQLEMYIDTFKWHFSRNSFT
ncbi:MAG: glycosyltransferase family 2 protein [Ignavibacteriae bacterium]|nr:glycosyltransferase family 2 protein [Ignavibacteriota bacterium]